jgi:hypothetical protein
MEGSEERLGHDEPMRRTREDGEEAVGRTWILDLVERDVAGLSSLLFIPLIPSNDSSD